MRKTLLKRTTMLIIAIVAVVVLGAAGYRVAVSGEQTGRHQEGQGRGSTESHEHENGHDSRLLLDRNVLYRA
ncbi:MAG: hypothetical protein ACLFOY_01215 [Desulfatibacillaceae bacterium]